MHGPGIAQPPPNGTSSPGMLAFIRVIFVGLPLISCGFLAWTATLRLAIVTRSTLNWWLFVGNVALNILWVVFLAQDNTDDFSSTAGNTGMGGMLMTGAAAIAYYLYADFKHYGPQRHVYAGYYPPQAAPRQGYQPPANTGYGYGGPTRPMTGPPVQNQPQPQPQPQLPPRNQPPQPNHTAPPRIDQVRAELDELSDLLRRDSGEDDKR
ncbi:hypothetical protein ABZ353_04035 [Streptomyces niveus]|uniref:hypothetical protein n=1 Tax=Streptomyces niveus TaxID=193462 RepID=UPI003406CE59